MDLQPPSARDVAELLAPAARDRGPRTRARDRARRAAAAHWAIPCASARSRSTRDERDQVHGPRRSHDRRRMPDRGEHDARVKPGRDTGIGIRAPTVLTRCPGELQVRRLTTRQVRRHGPPGSRSAASSPSSMGGTDPREEHRTAWQRVLGRAAVRDHARRVADVRGVVRPVRRARARRGRSSGQPAHPVRDAAAAGARAPSPPRAARKRSRSSSTTRPTRSASC